MTRPLCEWIADLHDTLMKCRRTCGAGRAKLRYLDEGFQLQVMHPEGDLSELLQHEYDRLAGILSTMRAVDDKSLFPGQVTRDFSE